MGGALPIFRIHMKPKTRDNLIYLVIALSIAGVLVGSFFYADSHGQVLVFPSRFAFRVVTSLLLVGYFIAREARKMKATFAEIVGCLLVAGLLNLAISFGFRQTVGQLPGILYAGLAGLETFLIVELISRVVLHSKRAAHR
jgi:hypothetical protein